MPASEKTWRNTRLLHRIFAATSLLMLFATIVMFAKDHARPWKTYQRTARRVNLKLTAWRKLQFETESAVTERHALQAELQLAKAGPIDLNAIDQFIVLLERDHQARKEPAPALSRLKQQAEAFNAERAKTGIDGDTTKGPFAAFTKALGQVGDLRDQLAQARAKLKQAEQTGDEAKEKAASERVAQLEQRLQAAREALEAARAERKQALTRLATQRQAVIDELAAHIRGARFREDNALKAKQFETADLDAARADVGLALRDGKPMETIHRLEAKVKEIKAKVDQLELAYQVAQATRTDLEHQLAQLVARQIDIEKKLSDNLADLDRLNRQIKDERSTFFVNGLWPGKKWLELPILDAFNSPLTIDNLWADDLEQPMGSFSRTRRFDRCTTCHKSIDKSMPGTADVPAFEPAEEVDFLIRFDGGDEESGDTESAAAVQQELAAILGEAISTSVPENERELRRTVGIILADEGLIATRDVTVQFVQPRSPAARAEFDLVGGNRWQTTATELRSFPLQPHRELRPAEVVILVDAFPTESDLRLTLRGNGGETIFKLPAETEAEQALAAFKQAGAQISVVPQLEGENIVLRSVDVGPDAFVALSAEGSSAAAFLEALSNTAAFGVDLRPPPVIPGLKVGDVLLMINDDPVPNRNWAVQRLMDAARSGETLRLRVRRGLAHPFATHPKLDLFLGSLSPHKKADFACTICHLGQGSATDFKWASHTPNSPEQETDWRNRLGWFNNAHWIYPMLPKRFAESGCIQCHHDVVELEPSEQFPEPPAPKLMHGYHLIRKYGCYGCHEINGFAGPGKRQGPDLRLEPNFYGAAQQFRGVADSGYDKLTSEERRWIDDLIAHPERDAVRHRIVEMIERDAQLAAANRSAQDSDAEAAKDSNDNEPSQQARFSTEVHTKIASLLKDVDTPGTLRRAGPALRYVGKKLSRDFLFDWIDNPKRFRPSTKMPRFFGNHGHLDPASRTKGEELGKVEVAGIVEYLLGYSQPFEYLDPPQGITPVKTSEEKNEQIARGKIEFERCLACHTHGDFPDIAEFRGDNEIVQGPDLTYLGDKFDTDQGRRWLYSWVKQPMRYHVRTFMPELFLDPITHKDADGKVTGVTDPAADIVAYLINSKREAYQPAPYQFNDKSLDALALENLKERFHWTKAEQYLKEGIPASLQSSLKGAELELVISAADQNAAKQNGDVFAKLLKEKKLRYIGRKALSKYGCFGCHDIPGFEDAKPIGTGLADWGVKETSKLAFEHILEYVEHGHGHAASSSRGHDGQDDADHVTSGPIETPPAFFLKQLESHSRIGFLYQKLTEPRSYDYHVVENKRYNEWLRMPQFSFDGDDREAIMTFILGLVADPPRAKYVYQPSPRKKAILEGKRLLEKYNCGGCHILSAERWELAYQPGAFEEQSMLPTFPFVLHQFTSEELEQAQQVDQRNMMRSTVRVLPLLDSSGHPLVLDEELEQVEDDYTYDPLKVSYAVQLYAPTILNGHPYQPSSAPLSVPASLIERRYGAWGGLLAKYMLPRVVAREAQVNPQVKGSEAWAWLPPPLIGEGGKVQTDWLHDFLLDPHPIRPAVVFRMPRFNMSSAEAAAIANYFAAIDGAEFPYEFENEQREEHLVRAERQYVERLKAAGVTGGLDAKQLANRHLDDAMKIVVDKNYCRQCHIVADFIPQQSQRAMGPDLAAVQRRLRPNYVRRWIANPTSILPYTAMPINVPYKPDDPKLLGTTVPQDLYHGNSIQQVDALVDLLMNFDVYAKRRALVTPLVQANQQAAPADENAEEKTNTKPAETPQ